MKTTQPNEPAYHEHVGLTKRELFAAMAMQGLISARYPPTTERSIAQTATRVADALIKELNGQEQPHDDIKHFLGTSIAGNPCHGTVWNNKRAVVYGYSGDPQASITCDWPCDLVIRVDQWLDKPHTP